MSFTVKSHSLSAITPVKFTYKYNTEEKLAGTYTSLKGDFAYYKHDALIGFKDAALSRKTCLVLTDVKSVKDVFDKAEETFNIGQIAGSLFLKVKTNFITETNDNLYVGGIGNPVLITIVPVGNNLAELRVNRTKYVQIDQVYPYTARLSEEIVDTTELQFRQYEVEYSKGLISFKVKTPEGYRFLSHGVDNVLRAVGVELSDTVVNSYHFAAEYKTRDTLNYNFSPDEKEVKYFNDLLDQQHKTDTELKQVVDSESNLLISCPTSELSKSKEVIINIASLKTDYTPAGTFSPSI
jgi:hypothetical protein